jgi:hypothetical protein
LSQTEIFGTILLYYTLLKEERMECNIGQDAVFLTHSEMPYFLGIFIKED